MRRWETESYPISPPMAISMSQPTLSRAGILAFMDDDARRAFTSYGNVVTVVAGQKEKVRISLSVE